MQLKLHRALSRCFMSQRCIPQLVTEAEHYLLRCCVDWFCILGERRVLCLVIVNETIITVDRKHEMVPAKVGIIHPRLKHTAQFTARIDGKGGLIFKVDKMPTQLDLQVFKLEV